MYMGSPDNERRATPPGWQTRVKEVLAAGHKLSFIDGLSPADEPIPNLQALGLDTLERCRLEEEGVRRQDETVAKQVAYLSDTDAATKLITYYRKICELKGVRRTQGERVSDGLVKRIHTMEKTLGLPSETAPLEEEDEKRILAKLEELGF